MEYCPFSKKPCENVKSFHVKQIVNGEASEYNCCHECANNIMSNIPTQFSPILMPSFLPLPVIPFVPVMNYLISNFQKLDIMEQEITRGEETRCPCCGLSLNDIKSSGRFGCKTCYDTFTDQIESLIPNLQAGARTHVGKKPKNNIPSLKKEMQRAVEDERYEDAARIRDQIKELVKRESQDEAVKINNLEIPD
jgi:protein arginine kinase activator